MVKTEKLPPGYSQEKYLLKKRETEHKLCAEYSDLVKRGFKPIRSTLRTKHTIEGTTYPCKTTVNQWIKKLSPIKPVGFADASDLEFLGIQICVKYAPGLSMFPGSPEGDLFKHL